MIDEQRIEVKKQSAWAKKRVVLYDHRAQCCCLRHCPLWLGCVAPATDLHQINATQTKCLCSVDYYAPSELYDLDHDESYKVS